MCIHITYCNIQHDRQCTYNVTLRRVHENHCCCGKAISITYWSVCVCVWVVHGSGRVLARVYPCLSIMQGACFILFAASLAPSHFSIFSHKWHDFREKKLQNIKCVFLFSVQRLFEMFLIMRKTERNIVIIVRNINVNCPLFWPDFNKTLICRTDLRI
jgi:hypothetical protein